MSVKIAAHFVAEDNRSYDCLLWALIVHHKKKVLTFKPLPPLNAFGCLVLFKGLAEIHARLKALGKIVSVDTHVGSQFIGRERGLAGPSRRASTIHDASTQETASFTAIEAQNIVETVMCQNAKRMLLSRDHWGNNLPTSPM